MKRTILYIFLFAALSFNAQTYTISPARSVTFSAVFFSVTINDIYMQKAPTTTLSVTWELISINVPLGWDYAMCDLGTCHTGIPAGPTTMFTSTVGGAEAFLGLNIDPTNIAGSGVVKVRVYVTGSPSNADTLTWTINAAPAGLQELASNDDVKIYPNPVSNTLYIDAQKLNARSIYLTDVFGRKVNAPYTSTTIDLSGLPVGFYLVTIETPERTLFKRILKE